jgi:fluoroacetyl-CoA thioesterase
MKASLQPGIRHESKLFVTEDQLVPAVFPKSATSAIRPEVFATGFLVGFLELACVELIIPHLDWPEEQAVGTMINITHLVATPAGLEVTAEVELIRVEGRKLTFWVMAHDGIDVISKGYHERMVINKDKFMTKTLEKLNLKNHSFDTPTRLLIRAPK